MKWRLWHIYTSVKLRMKVPSHGAPLPRVIAGMYNYGLVSLHVEGIELIWKRCSLVVQEGLNKQLALSTRRKCVRYVFGNVVNENLQEGSCLIYVICACLCIVVFLFCLASSCVSYDASFSGLSICDRPFGILLRLPTAVPNESDFL